MTELDRFIEAQDRPAGSGSIYQRALAELKAGHKTTHWMWFVFPQIAGVAEWFGAKPSPTARHFALDGRTEAEDYLAHDVLGPRLVAAFEAALESEEDDPVRLMGGIDAAKLKSCATLFAGLDGAPPVFDRALDRFFQGQRCPATEALVKS